jgi:hypothetical protein
MKKIHFITAIALIGSVSIMISSCEKDAVAKPNTPPVVTPSASFVEEFDNVGDLSAKGWAFANKSNPVGQTGWRQGRYESANSAQYKFLAPVPFLGFPAYSAKTSPNDFVSCDASCVNDAGGTGDISAWLISPSVPIKNGDKIIFYTRAVDDAQYPVYCKDRMQVRANFSNDKTDVGNSASSTGAFSTLLLDINPNYIYNDPAGNGGPAGYPRAWTKVTITVSGVPGGSVDKARFAFRYLGTDAGVFGGLAGANYPTVVGIDSLAFVHN